MHFTLPRRLILSCLCSFDLIVEPDKQKSMGSTFQYALALCLWEFFHAFLSSADFFFKINFSKIPSECQTVWFQISPNILSGLIWVQTVCKGYQQTILVGKELTQIFLIFFWISPSFRIQNSDIVACEQ